MIQGLSTPLSEKPRRRSVSILEESRYWGFFRLSTTVEFKPLVIPVVGRVETPLMLVPSEREVARVFTPRLSELAEPGRWSAVPWNGHQVWYYDLEGDPLWGATARMVRSLLGLP